MAVHMDKGWWRKSLAIGILPFAALGVAGCDNTEPAEDEAAVEEGDAAAETPAAEEEEAVIEETPVEGDAAG